MGGLIVGLVSWLSFDKVFGPLLGSSSLLAIETQSSMLFWNIGLALVLSLVSFWDDRYGLSPGTRFVSHAVVTAGIIWGAHLTVNAIPVPFGVALSLGSLSVPFTFLFIMWMTNLYNFMDGMDGFAGGMTVLGFAFLGFLFWTQGHTAIGQFSLLLVGATAGFLVFNFPPTRIFMGDVGSVPLGFLAGVLSVVGVRDRLFDIWVPVLIFSPFIVDATVTLFRRLFRGEKIWQAHREHYYQRLVLAGWSHRKTVLIEYALMAACGTSAFVYVHVAAPYQALLIGMWIVIYCSLIFIVRYVERNGKLDRLAISPEVEQGIRSAN